MTLRTHSSYSTLSSSLNASLTFHCLQNARISDHAANHTQCVELLRTCDVFLWLTSPSGPIHLAGIINLCKSGNSGIQSLISLLCIPNMEVRVGIQYNVTEPFVCFVEGHNLHSPAKGISFFMSFFANPDINASV